VEDDSVRRLLLLAGLQNIDRSLYEAAATDGAGPWWQLRHITLPLLAPAMLVVLIFRTLDAFRVFDLIYVLTGGGRGRRRSRSRSTRSTRCSRISSSATARRCPWSSSS
jgi:ABC-type sugar transport system permease subunit